MITLDGVDVMVLWCVLSPIEVAFRTMQRYIGPPDGDPRLVLHPSVHWWIKRHAVSLRELGLTGVRE